jgi:hypothetical protein
MTPADWRTLLEHVRASSGPRAHCDWLVLHDSSLDGKPLVQETLSPPAGLPDSIHRYLVLPSDLASVGMTFLERQGHWDVDDLRSPVIQLSLGKVNGPRLIAGRIYCAFGYYGEAETWIGKDEEFARCALRLFRQARSFLGATTSPIKGLIGPEASYLLAKGRLELRAL